MPMRSALLGTALLLLAGAAQAQVQILKREPQRGTLSGGESVLVDNGRCPSGQVQEVTAGTLGNRNGHAQPRGRRCVPRP